MDKKFCDKCKKEIKEKYYEVNIYEYPETKKSLEKEMEYCSDCYKKIKF